MKPKTRTAWGVYSKKGALVGDVNLAREGGIVLPLPTNKEEALKCWADEDEGEEVWLVQIIPIERAK